ncbi:hypothetical protein Q1695_009190 [Nippostrongylus brasiliensis]|nr:hypothetical protein Q1695_009190 [Nippostrongylus brasiliensis]
MAANDKIWDGDHNITATDKESTPNTTTPASTTTNATLKEVPQQPITTVPTTTRYLSSTAAHSSTTATDLSRNATTAEIVIQSLPTSRTTRVPTIPPHLTHRSRRISTTLVGRTTITPETTTINATKPFNMTLEGVIELLKTSPEYVGISAALLAMGIILVLYCCYRCCRRCCCARKKKEAVEVVGFSPAYTPHTSRSTSRSETKRISATTPGRQKRRTPRADRATSPALDETTPSEGPKGGTGFDQFALPPPIDRPVSKDPRKNMRKTAKELTKLLRKSHEENVPGRGRGKDFESQILDVLGSSAGPEELLSSSQSTGGSTSGFTASTAGSTAGSTTSPDRPATPARTSAAHGYEELGPGAAVPPPPPPPFESNTRKKGKKKTPTPKRKKKRKR